MEKPVHPFKDLFNQLGLPSEAAAIDAFCASHAPLPEDVRLADAPFWTPPQAAFLREATVHDADWAPVVDQLNVLLHQPPAGEGVRGEGVRS